MKYGALSYTTNNIGDDIQSLAAIQYLPHVDVFINRERLNAGIIADNTKLILNGWFMQNPTAWPPDELIDPLFVSFHITHQQNSLEYFKQESHIDYLRKHEPIGCRDFWTLRFLQSLGIDSYFSGCLTLTLKNEFDYRTDQIYFVDAFSQVPKKDQEDFALSITPKRSRSRIEIISHSDNDLSDDPIQRFDFARTLLRKYATANLVITSRIHCALPCLAFGTPVYFVDSGYDDPLSRNRFEGLLSYLDTISTSRWLMLSQIRLLKRSMRLLRMSSLINRRGIFSQIDWQKEGNELASIDGIRDALSSTVTSFINDKENDRFDNRM